jgi:hypothetical protein
VTAIVVLLVIINNLDERWSERAASEGGPYKGELQNSNVGLASTLADSKRDSSLRRPTISQERDGKKKRRPAPLGMTVLGCWLR